MTSEKSPYRLLWASVVISGNYSPATFTPNFLLDNGVIDSSWKAVGGTSGLEAAFYGFENEIRWGVNKESMNVTQEFSSTREVKGSFLVHDVAIKYLEKFSLNTYGNMGLNCLINIDVTDPKEWIIEKFSSHISGMDLLGMEANLIYPSGFPHIYRGIELKPAIQITREGNKETERPVLSAECNVHHGRLPHIQSYQDAIRDWEKHQSAILGSLKNLIEGE